MTRLKGEHGDNPRIVECPACLGECAFSHMTGYDPRDGSLTGWIERCDYCDGAGEVVEQAHLVTLGDLDTDAAASPPRRQHETQKMSIPFTQYMRPNGRKVPVSIDAAPGIESMANTFIEAGGWFDCESLTTGHVSLTAGFIVDDEPQDIAIRVVANGPGVPEAVEELVREAAAFVEKARA